MRITAMARYRLTKNSKAVVITAVAQDRRRDRRPPPFAVHPHSVRHRHQKPKIAVRERLGVGIFQLNIYYRASKAIYYVVRTLPSAFRHSSTPGRHSLLAVIRTPVLHSNRGRTVKSFGAE